MRERMLVGDLHIADDPMLAERLQLKHHSVVELINRAQHRNLVGRTSDPDDARAVRVQLTVTGERALPLLSALSRDELRRMGSTLRPPV